MAALDTPASLVARSRESATKLQALIPMEQQGRVREMLRCFDRALSALHDGGVDAPAGSDGSRRKRKSGPGRAATQPTKPKTRRKVPTRRVVEKWTPEDGFQWRKYGHKEIMNSRHPRLYFRCSYKQESGCPVTRQVQQSDDDPSLYVITYFGDHTCSAAEMGHQDVGTQPPFAVINFGSATSSSDDAEPRLPEEGEVKEELGAHFKVANVESTSSHTQPADASASSAACPDYYFGDTLRDYVTQLFSFEDNARLYCH